MGRKKKNDSLRQQEVLAARVSKAMYKQVEYLAKIKELNLTQLMRIAIREFVDRNIKAVS